MTTIEQVLDRLQDAVGDGNCPLFGTVTFVFVNGEVKTVEINHKIRIE